MNIYLFDLSLVMEKLAFSFPYISNFWEGARNIPRFLCYASIPSKRKGGFPKERVRRERVRKERVRKERSAKRTQYEKSAVLL